MDPMGFLGEMMGFLITPKNKGEAWMTMRSIGYVAKVNPLEAPKTEKLGDTVIASKLRLMFLLLSNIARYTSC